VRKPKGLKLKDEGIAANACHDVQYLPLKIMQIEIFWRATAAGLHEIATQKGRHSKLYS
jgi:hypothetical protein